MFAIRCSNKLPISRNELDELIQNEHAEDGIVIAKVDATKESALATRFKIRSYPTLKYFADRKVVLPAGRLGVTCFT